MLEHVQKEPLKFDGLKSVLAVVVFLLLFLLVPHPVTLDCGLRWESFRMNARALLLYLLVVASLLIGFDCHLVPHQPDQTT